MRGDAIETMPADPALAEAHRALRADPRIQFDLPMYEPPAPDPPQAPGWLARLAEWLGQEHPAMRLFVYALLIAAALLVAWLIVRAIARSFWWQKLWAGRGVTEPPPDLKPDEAPARALLSEADALAASGRFTQAVHLLLFRSIEDLDARRPALVRPAMTGRELARLTAIPERPRTAFARIARRVEHGLFAQRALGESDWRECRAAYEEFAFASSWDEPAAA